MTVMFGQKTSGLNQKALYRNANIWKLSSMKSNIKFRSVKGTFQKLKEAIQRVKQSPNVSVFAETTTTSNTYEMPEQRQKNFLRGNVTKTYKKAPLELKTSIDLETKIIVELINLDVRLECIARTPTFISLKDHKLDFRQNPSCRLINQAKNELDKVSKLIIEKINEELISELDLNQ